MMPYQSKILRSELVKRGATCASLARRLGVHRSTVTSVVAGRVRSRRIEAAIAQVLGVKASSIWPDVRRKPWAERKLGVPMAANRTPTHAA